MEEVLLGVHLKNIKSKSTVHIIELLQQLLFILIPPIKSEGVGIYQFVISDL